MEVVSLFEIKTKILENSDQKISRDASVFGGNGGSIAFFFTDNKKNGEIALLHKKQTPIKVENIYNNLFNEFSLNVTACPPPQFY